MGCAGLLGVTPGCNSAWERSIRGTAGQAVLAIPSWRGRACLGFSELRFGVSCLCWSTIYLEITNPGGNTECNRHVLNVHSLGKGSAGRQLQLLVLMGSWGAAQTMVGWWWSSTRWSVRAQPCSSCLLCERRALSWSPSAMALQWSSATGRCGWRPCWGCEFVVAKTRTGLPLPQGCPGLLGCPCSPAQPVGAQQGQGTENGCNNHCDPLLGKDWSITVGSGSIACLGRLCPEPMWECWDHWVRTLGRTLFPKALHA